MTDVRTAPLAHPDKLFIGGAWVSPSGEGKFDVISPATEEIYATVAEANEADVERAIGAAREAFDHGPWPRMAPNERAIWLRKLADGIDARAADFASIWPNEMGIVFGMAQAMSTGISFTYRNYADIIETFPFVEEYPTVSGAKLGLIAREAVGVVGAIVPWNAPAMLIALKVAPALAAGCTVVLKASPEAPGHALVLAEIADAIGLPAGVLNVLTADRIAREEIFGPVLSVIAAEDEADAVRIANDSMYGLNNAVFTNDIERAYGVARDLRSGTVGHNGMRVDFTIAFGGFKQSGVGREGGVEGLKPYLETKTILLQGRPQAVPAGGA